MGVLNIKFNGTDIVIDAKTDIVVNDKFIDEVATKDGFLCKVNFNKKSVKIDLVLKAKLLLIPITRKTTLELKNLEIENDYELIIEYDNFNGKFSKNYKLNQLKETKQTQNKAKVKKEKKVELFEFSKFKEKLNTDELENIHDYSNYIFQELELYFKNKKNEGKEIQFISHYFEHTKKIINDTKNSFLIDYNNSSSLYNLCIRILAKEYVPFVEQGFLVDKKGYYESAKELIYCPFYDSLYSKKRMYNLSKYKIVKDETEINELLKSNQLYLQKKEIEAINDFLINLKLILKKCLSKSGEILKERDDLFNELDLDGNGIIDVAEGNDDIIKLVRKFQSEKVKIDDSHMDAFIKISKYIKDRKSNLQYIFESCKEEKNANYVNEYIGIIKNEINTINSLLMHTISMIVSLKENDKVTFYEIYQTFENLNIFDSKWQKDVSEKLSDISNGLNSLMNSVNDMNRSISNELKNLTYTTDENFKSLNKSITTQLKGINSSIQFNNLITTINTYQSYRINKKLG